MTETFLGQADGWHSLLDDHIVPYGGEVPSDLFGDPGAGSTYFGINIGANNSSNGYNTRESQFGHRMGCLRSYWQISTTSGAVSQASDDLDEGRVPILSFKVDSLGGTNLGWDNFASGSGDTWFNGLLASLDALGAGPVLICLHHEPNFDASAASYLAMCRHAMALKGSSYPQILLVGGFLATSFFYTNQRAAGLLQFADWVQSDSCDLFGYDIYAPADASGDTWRTWAVNSASTRAQLDAIDPIKRHVIGEWGVHTWAANTSLTTTYMQDIYNFSLQKAYAIAYFDAAGTLETTLDQPGPSDSETGPPWVRKDKFEALLKLPTSILIPLGGIPS